MADAGLSFRCFIAWLFINAEHAREWRHLP
jgi:hypothetical protein